MLNRIVMYGWLIPAMAVNAMFLLALRLAEKESRDKKGKK